MRDAERGLFDVVLAEALDRISRDQADVATLFKHLPSEIYPIDVDRALEKIREIKEHTIFWGSGSESQQIFRDREAVMGNLFNTRVSVVRRETDAAIEFTSNHCSRNARRKLRVSGAIM